jgi:glutaminyl-peptide cyclotransferase
MKKMERPGLRLEFHLAALLLLFIGCSQDPNKGDVKAQPEVQVEVPVFSADSAFANVSRQVEFGPRVPGTAAHRSCGDWLESRLRTWADTVISQQFKTRTFDGKTIDGRNIIASFHPELGNRIMLCAHWDTRPFSDQDPENKNVPIDGANDGGSGVGVLLEVARHLSEKDPGIGIDIILFDVEDYGQPDDSPLPRGFVLPWITILEPEFPCEKLYRQVWNSARYGRGQGFTIHPRGDLASVCTVCR